MVNFKIITLLFFSVCFARNATCVELVIGEQRIKPGIVFIFEGAVKDQVIPASLHLPEVETNVHIEARVNWDSDNIPAGTPPGGFVPYLRITAKVTNQKASGRCWGFAGLNLMRLSLAEKYNLKDFEFSCRII